VAVKWQLPVWLAACAVVEAVCCFGHACPHHGQLDLTYPYHVRFCCPATLQSALTFLVYETVMKLLEERSVVAEQR
jgi:hypothetical protein